MCLYAAACVCTHLLSTYISQCSMAELELCKLKHHIMCLAAPLLCLYVCMYVCMHACTGPHGSRINRRNTIEENGIEQDSLGKTRCHISVQKTSC